jgi:hypothetical protein
MKLTDFEPFVGQHCETTAAGTLLKHIGIELSEPMLFGLGEGLGFLYWNMKSMGFPFIGGRVKTDLLTENLCRNLDLSLDVKKTTSLKKAWENVDEALVAGSPVGLKLDCFHLDYFTAKIHFAGHYVAMYGHEDDFAYLVDTDQQGSMVKTSLENLALARSAKGPMSSPNLSFTISKSGKPAAIEDVIPSAIQRNAVDYINPPITNIGYKGILKTSREIKKWFARSDNAQEEFKTTAMLMERAGTGGSLFRNLYRDFLEESSQILSSPELRQAHSDFIGIAAQWREVAELLQEAGETGKATFIDSASDVLIDLSDRERTVMTALACGTIQLRNSDSNQLCSH